MNQDFRCNEYVSSTIKNPIFATGVTFPFHIKADVSCCCFLCIKYVLVDVAYLYLHTPYPPLVIRLLKSDILCASKASY